MDMPIGKPSWILKQLKEIRSHLELHHNKKDINKMTLQQIEEVLEKEKWFADNSQTLPDKIFYDGEHFKVLDMVTVCAIDNEEEVYRAKYLIEFIQGTRYNPFYSSSQELKLINRVRRIHRKYIFILKKDKDAEIEKLKARKKLKPWEKHLIYK